MSALEFKVKPTKKVFSICSILLVVQQNKRIPFLVPKKKKQRKEKKTWAVNGKPWLRRKE